MASNKNVINSYTYIANPRAIILIVDDERRSRPMFDAFLRLAGYARHCAATGETIALGEQCAPELILLDITIPIMDDHAMTYLFKANFFTSNIPINIRTAFADYGARLTGLTDGTEEFQTSPIDRVESLNLLRLKELLDFHQVHNTILKQQIRARTMDIQRFRMAMDATTDAIMMVARNTMRFVEVNATASRMLRYTRTELLQMGPAQLEADTHESIENVYDNLIALDDPYVMVETQLKRKDGSEVQVEIHRYAQRYEGDWIVFNVVRDITERMRVESQLHHLAHYDALTGLPNRTLFDETLKKTLLQALENTMTVAVLFIDLDHFKNVNDTLGHAIGDELLCQFANRLVQCVRIRDTVGRLGGDEFAIILVTPTHHQDTVLVADKIRDVLRLPFYIKGHEVTLTASIGLTVHPDDASDPETLLKYADTAMYRAKQAGRDTFRFFTAKMNVEALARLDLENALRKALENGEFELYFQPKAQLKSGRTSGLEALLRWQRPGHGLVSPGDFIPILEETGLIVRIGSWVITTVCKQIRQWMDSTVGPVPVSVNVSGRQFIEGDLLGDVIKALSDNDIMAEMLELELTESSLMANTEQTIASLRNLKKLGVQISIDDFGTGYSSLAYLRRFPIDKLKIDIAFIRDVTSNPDDAAITLAIIHMAHGLKMEVIAEGVETEAQLDYLECHDCDHIQGYYFSRPLRAQELEHFLLEGKCLRKNDVLMKVSKRLAAS